MYLRVHGVQVPVVLENDLHDDDGQPTYGLYRPNLVRGKAGTIVLDMSTPVVARQHVLFHELAHARKWMIGKADQNDEEGLANREALEASELLEDLANQKDEDVYKFVFAEHVAELKHLENTRRGYASIYTDTASGDWPTNFACPHCNVHHHERVIQKSIPRFHARIGVEGGYCMDMQLSCDRCERRSTWLQQCTAEGTPLPKVLGRVLIKRFTDIEAEIAAAISSEALEAAAEAVAELEAVTSDSEKQRSPGRDE